MGNRSGDKRLPAEQTESESSVPAIVLYCECAQGGVSALLFWSGSFLTCIPGQYLCNCRRRAQEFGMRIDFWIGTVIFSPCKTQWSLSVSVWAGLSDRLLGRTICQPTGEAPGWSARAQTHTQRLYKVWLGSKEPSERGWCSGPYPQSRNGHVFVTRCEKMFRNVLT